MKMLPNTKWWTMPAHLARPQPKPALWLKPGTTERSPVSSCCVKVSQSQHVQPHSCPKRSKRAKLQPRCHWKDCTAFCSTARSYYTLSHLRDSTLIAKALFSVSRHAVPTPKSQAYPDPWALTLNCVLESPGHIGSLQNFNLDLGSSPSCIIEGPLLLAGKAEVVALFLFGTVVWAKPNLASKACSVFFQLAVAFLFVLALLALIACFVWHTVSRSLKPRAASGLVQSTRHIASTMAAPTIWTCIALPPMLAKALSVIASGMLIKCSGKLCNKIVSAGAKALPNGPTMILDPGHIVGSFPSTRSRLRPSFGRDRKL